MADPFIGQIIMFAGNFAPRGWAFCNGQLLSIASNSALFSILGTTYGGDGRTSFGLPELRGRFAIHSGGNSAGPGLPAVRLGQRAGTTSNTLTVNQLPSHNHALDLASASEGDSNNPSGNRLAVTDDRNYASTGTGVPLGTIASTGGNQPIDNMPPYNAVNYIIALQGVFPSPT